MKIVVKGTKPVPYWCGMWRCIHCGTVYEVGINDQKKVKYHDDQRDGESLSVHCEVCEVQRYLVRQKGRTA